MVYITGDIHGVPWYITKPAKKLKLTSDDIIVILGDVGANFFGDERDHTTKDILNNLQIPILCIHGNHEQRPATIPSYQLHDWHGGKVWIEPKWPNLMFAKDGEIFDLEGIKAAVLGGAYSVDKDYRIARGYGWWADEQPSEEIKAFVEAQLQSNKVDVIFSHTCPFKYEPIEMFLPGIDQSTVDDSTEHWLDKIEENTQYAAWYCGHWHINKRIDKMHFLFHSFECLNDINPDA